MSQPTNSNFVLFIAVVNTGMGSKFLAEAKTLGVTGGTICLGRGTAKTSFLSFLGLDEVKKEILLMIAYSDIEDAVHQGLAEKFHLHKPNHGIMFSSPVDKFLGLVNNIDSHERESKGGSNMQKEAIFTIVDRGRAEEVVDAALESGAVGATIINARGSGIHEKAKLFAMPIEPEKEIVMILIDKVSSDKVFNSIREYMGIDEPGKGVMFTLDVNKTSGIRDKKDK